MPAWACSLELNRLHPGRYTSLMLNCSGNTPALILLARARADSTAGRQPGAVNPLGVGLEELTPCGGAYQGRQAYRTAFRAIGQMNQQRQGWNETPVL